MEFLYIGIAILAFIFLNVRMNNLNESEDLTRKALQQLAGKLGFDINIRRGYDGEMCVSVNKAWGSTNVDNLPVTETAFQKHQEQFATLVKDLGYKFVPEKVEEKHEIKRTPAAFVAEKKKKRRG